MYSLGPRPLSRSPDCVCFGPRHSYLCHEPDIAAVGTNALRQVVIKMGSLQAMLILYKYDMKLRSVEFSLI